MRTGSGGLKLGSAPWRDGQHSTPPQAGNPAPRFHLDAPEISTPRTKIHRLRYDSAHAPSPRSPPILTSDRPANRRRKAGTMLLATDIGNTTLQIGVFTDRKLGPTWRLATDHNRLADEYGILVASLLRSEGIDIAKIDGAIISSVVPALAPVFQEVMRRFLKVEPILVSDHMLKPLKIGIEHADELGADRIADAVGAITRHDPPPLIIVDFGTATVFDAINEDGVYVGGAIAPGIGISTEALFERASRLASIELVRPPSAIGRRTETALQSGILYGYVGLVEGIIARFREELGPARVIATGGWARRIAAETDVLDEVDSDLILHGLRELYFLNAEGTP